jgi:hypothetical protein
MILVTGLPRSGTSLMMRILESLSIPITGEEFFDGKDEDRKERAKYLNPEGFHEIRGIVVSGKFKNPEEFKGKAVKVIVPGILRVPKEHVEKIIFCLRDPSEIIESQRNLTSNIEVATSEGKKYAPELIKRSFDGYIRNMSFLILGSDEDFWNKTLVVSYKNLMTKPEEEIQRISDFLNVPFVNANLVNSSLYRSKAVIESDLLAIEIYNSIYNKDFSNIKDKLKEYLQQKAFENVEWVDESEFGLWLMDNLSLHKSLVSNNKGLRDKLTESSKRSPHCYQCKYYSRNGEEYTIKRPGELPDLTRKKVTCSHFNEEKTLEFCHNCFQSILFKEMMKK